MNSKITLVALSIALSLTSAGQATERGPALMPLQLAQSIPEEPVYASHMMTQEERDAHRARLRAATTDQERDQIRKEHHAQMQARAKERGVTLPDEPPPRGPGVGPGPGPGMGGGMGPGPGASPRGGGAGR
jgi:hypothetical protein